MNVMTNFPLQGGQTNTPVFAELLEEAKKTVKKMTKAERVAVADALGKQASAGSGSMAASYGLSDMPIGDAGEALGGAGSVAKAKGWKGLLKGKGAKAGMAGLALQLALSYMISKGGDIAGQRLQTDAIKQQTASMTPQDMLNQAMMPDLQAKSQLAREALMNQLGGVHGPSRLASGESYVGG